MVILRERPFTYMLRLILFLCIVIGTTGEAYGQRARKHREGILKADSIQAKHVTDSLALADTLSLREERLQQLEAPVDTTSLVRRNDSIMQVQAKMVKERKTWLPVPNKAIWLSLAIPGAGQIYNRKYWKLPLVYGGFLGCVYALTWNGQMYKDYSQAYQDIMSDNPNNDSYLDFLGPGATYEYVQSKLSYYQTTFKNRKDLYRRQRDLSIIAFIGVYLLSVIDAYVDAELSNFDISTDLSMSMEPALFNDPYRHRPQGIGIQWNINF